MERKNKVIIFDNNEEFNTLMTTKAYVATTRNFANAHKGEVVEFDGCVALMMKHENYNTRFDVCLAVGDYTADETYGPLFAFENVNFSGMNVSGTDTVAEGMDFRIAGEIVGYSSEGNYIILKPVFMRYR